VGRLVSIATVLFFVAHFALGWGVHSGLAGIPSVLGQRDPRYATQILIDGLTHASEVLACFLLTVLVASGFRRPRPEGRRWSIPWEWPVAAGVLVVAALVQVHVRFDPALGQSQAAPWVERVGVAVGLLAAASVLVLLQITVGLVLARGPEKAARRESLRDALTLWGFVLVAGSLLFLERRTVSLLGEVMILGPRAPGGGTLFDVWLRSNRLVLLANFCGLVALCFGGLPLGRRERAGVSPRDESAAAP
jgi:hypothetical protein